MKLLLENWQLTHSDKFDGERVEPIEAQVPGAVQLDYARAFDYEPYYYGLNFKQFDWCEDEYFFYETKVDIPSLDGKAARLCFEGIDYKYEIRIDGEALAAGEGAFTPVYIDVTAFSGKEITLTVALFPIPKRFAEPQNRSQASACCKPPSSYGWDWHPRLVPTGIWKEVYLETLDEGEPYDLEVSYLLTEDMNAVTVTADFSVVGKGEISAALFAPDGSLVAGDTCTALDFARMALTLESPLLWYPRGYGDQPIYTLKISGGNKTIEKRLGFRRSRLVLNDGSIWFEMFFPKGPMAAPATIEINGQKIFAKGSNMVNVEIFPSMMTKDRYDELLDMAYDANMNIVRMWGGQYINHDCFYDKCDELGIMVWQEFMLSCNKYPDEDAYLEVLEQEATSIVKALRTHPSIAFWCGGNELFNSWSGLTNQSHALRLLDKICYELDRNTPFNMTSPLHGMAHGSYVKAVFHDHQRREGNYANGWEFIEDLKKSSNTAYTEFGCNGGAPKDYILKYIMDEEDYADCNEESEVWVAHHAFRAWTEAAWLGIPEIYHYFGECGDVDDIMDKSLYLQALCYKTMFEEMRRQAPKCMMAINWDFNEPWPCAAGNSLVAWPAVKKDAYFAVKEALRPTILSLELPRNRYLTGDSVNAKVWILNDNGGASEACEAKVYLCSDGEKKLIATIPVGSIGARQNAVAGEFVLEIDENVSERFSIAIECDIPEYCSVYDLVHNKNPLVDPDAAPTEREIEDISDFLK